MATSVALHEQRVHAALASKGTSGDAIYDVALATARAMNLRGRVLEFGAGTGTLIGKLLAEDFGIALTGADLLSRPAGIPAAIDWIQADLNAPLPCPDASFDATWSVSVRSRASIARALLIPTSAQCPSGHR